MHIIFTFLIAVLNCAQVIADDMEARVVNGQVARIKNHPHSVFLFVLHAKNEGNICGGSIVNQRVVLSAAHCFEKVHKSARITAHVGSSHIERGRIIYVISVRVHPRYNQAIIANDIALAGLEDPIIFGLKTQRIAIAMKRPDRGMAKIAGWGAVKESPHYKYSDYLHVVSVPFMSRDKCERIFSSMNKGTFCAGRLRANSHPSIGDSGSPLVFNNYIQIGIVSYKINSISRSMVIYTDVAYFYDWIKESAKSVYCNKKIHLSNNFNHTAKYSQVKEDFEENLYS